MILIMTQFIVSVRRERRQSAVADWPQVLRGIAGLEIRGDANPNRVQVEATDDAIGEVRQKLGELCHIEAVIVHRPL